MTAISATRRGRRAADRLMTDTCTIAEGDQVYDPVTDSYVPADGATRYAGACTVTARDNADRQVEAGAETVSLWPIIVSVPMSVTTVQVDDVVTVTESRLDAALVGARFRVRQVPTGSFLTARRLGCEESA
jgi:hypothetical protein